MTKREAESKNMCRVKFGIQFRNFPSLIGGGVLDKMIDVANMCETLGFDSIWMIDHLEMRPPISYESQPIPECWATISALASATKHIKIGSLVTCSLFRNPFYLSSICNTVHEVSNGRLITGIGSGWFEGEFRNYGVAYPNPSQRLAVTKAVLTILRQKRKNSFQIWLGGSGEKGTLKLVAKSADGCSLFGDPDSVHHKLSVLENYCMLFNRRSREITKSKHSNVIIAKDKTIVFSKLHSIVPDESRWSNFIANNIVGTPDDCRRQVERYLDAGIEYLTLSFPDLFEEAPLDLFSREVIEQLN
jgi:alkanesulfonate monooxygenase SsuD/methylene tetrahydromethanopterin reductase-like flavin-dependent oxidoreductase (luciferase family)